MKHEKFAKALSCFCDAELKEQEGEQFKSRAYVNSSFLYYLIDLRAAKLSDL